MTLFYGISPANSYQQSFKGVNPGTEQASSQISEPKHEEKVHELSSEKVGSASSKIARKGIKHIWKKFTTYLAKLFKNNEKTIEDGKKVLDVAADAHRAVTIYQELNGENPAPTYNYEA